MECFEECAHHVATGVPKEDWAEWATLLSTSEECSDDAPVSDGLTGGNSGQHAVSPMHRNRLDKLACVDEVKMLIRMLIRLNYRAVPILNPWHSPFPLNF